MNFHPASLLFPMMSDSELNELAEDIKKSGQIEPVVLYHGEVLDGRNRLKACELAGLEPKFTEANGDVPSPTLYALKLWVEALRSGKYKQAVSVLRSGDRFCCLGVACELAVDAGVAERSGDGYSDSYGSEVGKLPVEVVFWLGLKTSYGEIPGRKSLIAMNDSGRSFSEIADIIESEPEGLFKAEAGQ